MTNAEIHSRVGRRLGAVLAEERPCPFCLGVIDRFGIHPEVCTGGGDKTAAHHCVRNDLHVHSKRGAVNPVLEAGGVLDSLGLQEDRPNRERPADVLLCRAQDVQTGTGGMGNAKVALDVGIVCPQATSHLGDAASE
eukprot:4331302-Karenia_brevis.AAC.1